jgi:hypothetical protein
MMKFTAFSIRYAHNENLRSHPKDVIKPLIHLSLCASAHFSYGQ